MSRGHATGIELGAPINEITVERAYQRAGEAQRANLLAYATTGLLSALHQDPKILKALEGMLEVMTRIAEGQQGRTLRTSSSASLRVMPTEVQLVRLAYESACSGNGNAAPQCAWIYGAAYELAHGVPEGALVTEGLGSEARDPAGRRIEAPIPAPYRPILDPVA